MTIRCLIKNSFSIMLGIIMLGSTAFASPPAFPIKNVFKSPSNVGQTGAEFCEQNYANDHTCLPVYNATSSPSNLSIVYDFYNYVYNGGALSLYTNVLNPSVVGGLVETSLTIASANIIIWAAATGKIIYQGEIINRQGLKCTSGTSSISCFPWTS